MHSGSPVQVARAIAASFVEEGGLFDGSTVRSAKRIREGVRLLLTRIQDEISSLIPGIHREEEVVEIFFSRLLLFVDHLLQSSAAVVAIEAHSRVSEHGRLVAVAVRVLDCACEILDRNLSSREVAGAVETGGIDPTIPPESVNRVVEIARASLCKSLDLKQPMPPMPSPLPTIARDVLVVTWQRVMAKHQPEEVATSYVELFALRLFTLLRAELPGYSVGVENARRECRQDHP